MLEALLTHPPDPADPYQSITRQIKKKLALVGRRCRPCTNYAAFNKSEIETIWTKMYEYRSCLAHGSTPDFKRKLNVLGNMSERSVSSKIPSSLCSVRRLSNPS